MRHYKYNDIEFVVNDEYNFNDWDPIDPLMFQYHDLKAIIVCLWKNPDCIICNLAIQIKEANGELEEWRIS